MLTAAAVAAKAVPFAGAEVDLEVRRVTDGAVKAVIAAGVITPTVGLQLVEVIEDVEGHWDLRPRFGPRQPFTPLINSVVGRCFSRLMHSIAGSTSPNLGSQEPPPAGTNVLAIFLGSGGELLQLANDLLGFTGLFAAISQLVRHQINFPADC